MGEIKLLDCTLRDGGYINDWEFGHDEIVTIFERLVSAKVDIIEIGFLDERREYDFNRTIMPNASAVQKNYEGLDKGASMVVGMIDYGTCKVSNLIPAAESIMDGIRVIFKKHVMHEAISFCSEVKKLGYSVFVQAVSITSYDDGEFEQLLQLVNKLNPYAFSLVDTYGLLHKNQLIHYFDYANEKLNPGVGLGYHSHNNFQLGYANCIELLEKKIDRLLLVDGSLYGMGKGAGNTPVELLAMYLNENCGKSYHNSQLLEAIDVTIMDSYRKYGWGYGLKYFIAASNDCHPNYVTKLMEKGKLSVKSINEILKNIPKEKKLLYDEAVIENLYQEHQSISYNDKADYNRLKEEVKGREVLILGPGKRIVTQSERIRNYIEQNDPIVFSINFLSTEWKVDYLFMSNAKRYVKLATALNRNREGSKTIATSNVTRAQGEFDFVFGYEDLLDEEAMIRDNPLCMLLKLLDSMGAERIGLAGFDGYGTNEEENYVNQNMEYHFSEEKAELVNRDTIESMNRIGLKTKLMFVTKSRYQDYVN